MNEHEIKELLSAMENSLKLSLNDLFHFEVPGKFYEYEKAIYKYLPVKPIKTLRQALNVDREILTLIINFTDLQARTIAVITNLLNDTQVRYEKTVVIIIHNDSTGNSKLRNWGRENGLTVIAIYYQDMLNKQDIKKIINIELFSNDPFDITGPVSSENDFFGRRDEAITFARKIQNGNINSILGLRKTGKTSLLNRITNEANEKHDDLIIFVDCSRDDLSSLDATKLIKTLFTNINNSIEKDIKYSILSVIKDYSPITIEAIIDLIEASSKQIVIIFDEFDYITPSSPTNKNWEKDFNVFWRQMRAIYQETCRRKKNLSFILCGVSSKWFRVAKINDIENSALSLIPEEYIKPLHEKSVIAMVKSLGARCGLSFNQPSLEFINNETSGIPSWTRKACSFINRQIPIENRPFDIGLNFTKSILNEYFMGDGVSYSGIAIDHLFTMYPEVKDLLVRFNLDKNCLSPTEKQLLISYGIINKDLIYSGSLMKNSIASCLETKPVQKADAQPADISAPIEWTEEIAELARRQNIIERVLRRIIIEVIRSDSRNNPTKGTTKDRIIASIEKKRRDELSCFSVEQILEKTYWLELIGIFKKEWTNFSFCFGDEGLFTKYMMHLNDRPYAHAKSLDAVDIVAFKTSLKYLEEKIQKYENA
jgi:hypothetical protein